MGSRRLDRLCEVEGRIGTYYILRKGKESTRILSVIPGDWTGGTPPEGIIVPTEDLRNERRVETPPEVQPQ